MELKTKNDALEFVRNHWLFTEDEYPELKNIKNHINFGLKHVLLHMQKNMYRLVEFEVGIDVTQELTFDNGYLKTIHKPQFGCGREYYNIVTEMLINFLAIKGLMSPEFHHNEEIDQTLIDEQFDIEGKASYSFTELCLHVSAVLAAICENQDHEIKRDYVELLSIIDKAFNTVEFFFSEEKLSEMLKAIPEVMKSGIQK